MKQNQRRNYIPLLPLLAGAAVILLLIALFIFWQDGDKARGVATTAPTAVSVEEAMALSGEPQPTATAPALANGAVTPNEAVQPFSASPVAGAGETAPSAPAAGGSPAPAAAATLAPPYPQAVDPAEVENLLSRLSLEQKIGQMLMVGLPGPAVDSVARRRTVDQAVGGVIFLERNTSDPQQVAQFTQALQNLARSAGPGLPLFIGWNHEGGPVTREAAGVTAFPSAMAVGATGQPQRAYGIGQAVGQEMRSLGVNMNYAPTLDVNTNPANPIIGLRAFGSNPELVALMGEQYIRGQQGEGVIAVAKHFPGHGDVAVDSHLALPTVEASLEQLWQTALPPFNRALQTDVGGVMVAHLRIPALDPGGWPTSLSPYAVDALLRRQMGYDGVVMTDDMGMAAIRDNYPLAQAAVQAVLAGNDLLLSVDTDSDVDTMRNALLAAVAEGRLPVERIDASVRRLLRLKLAYNLSAPPPTPLLPNQEAHSQLAYETGMAAARLLKDSGQLPLSLPTQQLLLLSPTEINPGTAAGDNQSLLGELLAARGINVRELFYDPGSPADIASATARARSLAPEVDALIVVTWDAGLRFSQRGETAQETMVNELLQSGRPLVLIFGQLPYDGQRVPGAPTQIAIYGDSPGQLAGAVRLLLDG